MQVALVAPPWYRVPPDAYGGIEVLEEVDHDTKVRLLQEAPRDGVSD
jgi:hypothetical protein